MIVKVESIIKIYFDYAEAHLIKGRAKGTHKDEQDLCTTKLNKS